MLDPKDIEDVLVDGVAVGFTVKLRIPYYRGVCLSLIDDITIKYDNEVYPKEVLTFTTRDGTFTFDENGGRDGSGAIVMEATGTNGTPMCFIEYKNMDKPAKIKVKVWLKPEGLDENASISVTVKWLVSDSKGANDVKPGWLPERFTSLKTVDNPKDGEWLQFQVVNLTPDIIPCKMAILLGLKDSFKGRVLVDDLQVFAE